MKRANSGSSICALILCAICWNGCKTAPPKSPNIILISIDSLRRDHLGCYDYSRNTTPFIDHLAATGIRFDQAVSGTSWTLPAHAEMFTGLYDSAHGLVGNGLRLAEGITTLAELLSKQGYQTSGFFGGPYLHPTFGLGQGFDSYLSCMTRSADTASGENVRAEARKVRSPSHSDITGPRTRDKVIAWARHQAKKPYFLFIHFWDVHYDYIPPRKYAEMFDPNYTGDLSGRGFSTNPRVKRDMGQRDLEHLIALYDGEIRSTDDILRDIFAELGKQGLLKNTLTVITADHGEEFFEHGGKGHQRTLFDEVLRVPLIIHWPEGLASGRVVDEQVRLIDLMPTLVSSAGYSSPLSVQGRNLMPLLRGEPFAPEPALAELLVNRRSLRALRTNKNKLVIEHDGARPVLFDLDVDPSERRPIDSSPPRETELERMATRLREEVQRAKDIGKSIKDSAPEPIQADEEIQRRLRSLGYIEGR